MKTDHGLNTKLGFLSRRPGVGELATLLLPEAWIETVSESTLPLLQSPQCTHLLVYAMHSNLSIL